MSILYILLAALGLGFLIFIHELGHYFVAKWVGIEVETFSIGFGRPIVKWMRGSVQWQIAWIPFGGYVRVKGADAKGDKEPHEIPGGFFAAKPFDRIKFAIAGPIVNLIFAFIAFAIIWGAGGREKPFHELTHRVGWVDPQSQLFAAGVRPGDAITAYDGHAVTNARDHFQAPLLVGNQGEVSGYHINYVTGEQTPFHVEVATYPHPAIDLPTLGVLEPATYLFERGLSSGSPLDSSGIQEGDRLVWADGDLIFSVQQLSALLQEGKALATVERDGEYFLRRVPRVPIGELSLTFDQRADLSDWQYATGVRGGRYLPYELGDDNRVLARLAFAFPEHVLSSVEEPLQVGDRIVAIDGTPVETPMQLFGEIQQHEVQLMVKRELTPLPLVGPRAADASFDKSIDFAELERLAMRGAWGEQQGELVLLKPITPVTVGQLARLDGQLQRALVDQRNEIMGIRDDEQRQARLRALETYEQRPMLGVQFEDRRVSYNPPPWTLYGDVLVQTWWTFKSLFIGNLSPKMLSGPIGIVTASYVGWTMGIKEALFWLGVISINLGVLNLLPIPVLDGGHICFALYEMITRKRIKAKTMERMIIPFVVLLIGFFLFVTYHDIVRLVGHLF